MAARRSCARDPLITPSAMCTDVRPGQPRDSAWAPADTASVEQSGRIRIVGMSPDTPAATIAARITELLPGAVFDAHGHGAFQRAHYAVTFAIDADGSGVEGHLNHSDGFTAVKRVA